MGLDTKTKKKITEETRKRYCLAKKKEKGRILDEFCATTGYNRKYAIQILTEGVHKMEVSYNGRKTTVAKVERARPENM